MLILHSTNGHEIEEFDFITHKQSSIPTFPSPQELKERFLKFKSQTKAVSKETEKLIFQQYPTIPGFSLRYYQEKAIESVLDAVISGKKRVLLMLATGTGKTIIAFHIVWRLVKSGYFRRVLFIADRNFLRNQAYNVFEPFGDARAFIPDKNNKIPKHQRYLFFNLSGPLYVYRRQ